jgi:mono/diheme cytochrome c family protein
MVVKRLAVTFAMGLLGVLAVRAAGSAGTPPAIRFDESAHDFGEIPSDRKVSHRWVFHNDGGSPLEIVSTRPSCGCTLTVLQQTSIPPGGEGAIEMTFDPAGQHGSVRKSLAVSSNDPARPTVLLTLRAQVKSVAVPQVPGGHPPIAGQSLLMGTCAGCHAAPAAAKSDEPLYAAVCAMCHGPRAEGGLAPSLRDAAYLGSRSDEELAQGIAFGTANPRMPGFAAMMGGPLDEAQVSSLVRLLRRWGPVPER